MTLLELWDERELPLQPTPRSALDSGRYGELLGGRYELRLPLGSGDSSTVWLARDLGGGGDVAVKVLAPELAGSALFRARFAAEATFAAWVRSSRVVRGRDSDVGSRRPWIAFDLVRGETLASRLERTGACSLDEAARLVRQLAIALGRLRSFGVVHRDLAPNNLLIDAHGRLIVADLGSARLAGPLEEFDSERGRVTGTPGFRAPEQELALEEVDSRADVYALTRLMAYALEPVSSPPAVPSSVAALPRAAAFFERGTALDPDRRFQTAEEAASAFCAAVACEPAEPWLLRPSTPRGLSSLVRA